MVFQYLVSVYICAHNVMINDGFSDRTTETVLLHSILMQPSLGLTKTILLKKKSFLSLPFF